MTAKWVLTLTANDKIEIIHNMIGKNKQIMYVTTQINPECPMPLPN